MCELWKNAKLETKKKDLDLSAGPMVKLNLFTSHMNAKVITVLLLNNRDVSEIPICTYWNMSMNHPIDSATWLSLVFSSHRLLRLSIWQGGELILCHLLVCLSIHLARGELVLCHSLVCLSRLILLVILALCSLRSY